MAFCKVKVKLTKHLAIFTKTGGDVYKRQVQALQAHPECKAALCGGYLRPDDYPLLNQYISEFGDPYSRCV